MQTAARSSLVCASGSLNSGNTLVFCMSHPSRSVPSYASPDLSRHDTSQVRPLMYQHLHPGHRRGRLRWSNCKQTRDPSSERTSRELRRSAQINIDLVRCLITQTCTCSQETVPVYRHSCFQTIILSPHLIAKWRWRSTRTPLEPHCPCAFVGHTLVDDSVIFAPVYRGPGIRYFQELTTSPVVIQRAPPWSRKSHLLNEKQGVRKIACHATGLIQRS